MNESLIGMENQNVSSDQYNPDFHKTGNLSIKKKADYTSSLAVSCAADSPDPVSSSVAL